MLQAFFTQNGQGWKKNRHFEWKQLSLCCLALNKSYFCLSLRYITWFMSQQPKTNTLIVNILKMWWSKFWLQISAAWIFIRFSNECAQLSFINSLYTFWNMNSSVLAVLAAQGINKKISTSEQLLIVVFSSFCRQNNFLIL